MRRIEEKYKADELQRRYAKSLQASRHGKRGNQSAKQASNDYDEKYKDESTLIGVHKKKSTYNLTG